MKTLRKVQWGALAVPQYALHETGAALGGIESGLNWTADRVASLKDAAYEGSDYFKTLREDINAEMAIYELAAMDKLEDVDVTSKGASSAAALTKIQHAQRMHDENIMLRTALAQKTQDVEKLLKVKPSKATKDYLAKKKSQLLEEQMDRKEIEMRTKTGLKDLKLKSLKRGTIGPAAPEQEPDLEQSTGTTKLVL